MDSIVLLCKLFSSQDLRFISLGNAFLKLQLLAKLTGGGKTGSPAAVTYADESPPSTVKSVPYVNVIKTKSPMSDGEDKASY